jgi:hypothetical protein
MTEFEWKESYKDGVKLNYSRVERLKDYYVLGGDRRTKALEQVSTDGDILQFGVFSGASIALIHEYFVQHLMSYGHIWGFDSFVGLPEETKYVKFNDDWKPGCFNAKEWFGIDEPREIMRRLYKDFSDFGIENLTLVDGFFCDTLVDSLARYLKPASFIDIDCDLYISAYQALDWVFRNKLYQKGTILYYDDWESGKRLEGGEWKAHLELTKKYGIECKMFEESMTAGFKIVG